MKVRKDAEKRMNKFLEEKKATPEVKRIANRILDEKLTEKGF